MTEPRGARLSFIAFVGGKPKVALSILIGAVGFCGLLSAILFFSAFDINAQSESLPSALQERPAEELPSSGGLLAQRVNEMAASLNEIRIRLASVERSVAEPMVAMVPEPEQTSKPPCTKLPGAEFLFEYDSDDLDVEEKERNRDAMQAVIGYFRSGVFAPGDYMLVVGHADVSGDVVYNQRLSERRAQVTVQRLLKILKVWIAPGSPVADRMYPIAAGEGAKAWEEDPSTGRNRRTLIYHCRGDQMADPGPSIADAGTFDDGLTGRARLTPSGTSPVDSLEIN